MPLLQGLQFPAPTWRLTEDDNSSSMELDTSSSLRGNLTLLHTHTLSLSLSLSLYPLPPPLPSPSFTQTNNSLKHLRKQDEINSAKGRGRPEKQKANLIPHRALKTLLPYKGRREPKSCTAMLWPVSCGMGGGGERRGGRG